MNKCTCTRLEPCGLSEISQHSPCLGPEEFGIQEAYTWLEGNRSLPVLYEGQCPVADMLLTCFAGAAQHVTPHLLLKHLLQLLQVLSQVCV